MFKPNSTVNAMYYDDGQYYPATIESFDHRNNTYLVRWHIDNSMGTVRAPDVKPHRGASSSANDIAKGYDSVVAKQAEKWQKTQEHGRGRGTFADRKEWQNYNNKCKMHLFERFVDKPKLRVLDVACGRGGDIFKWENRKVASYYGMDISGASIQNAKERVHCGRTKVQMAADFVQKDCFNADVEWDLPSQFDVVSCMLAMHYAFDSETRARTFLQRVSRALIPGGYFLATTVDCRELVQRVLDRGTNISNSVYSVTYHGNVQDFSSASAFGHSYTFNLAEHVEALAECLVEPQQLTKMAAEYGLVLVDGPVNFAQTQPPKGGHGGWRLNPDEWDLVSLYCSYAFQKRDLDELISAKKAELKEAEARAAALKAEISQLEKRKAKEPKIAG
eukprot:TRINITY_DN62275_c0_g1_i2.p1 TRINITY_DN62275_c0_g1~~TRINITY_DN62275_c0_g1_i2.p1  ORF type:complete len:390 (-),score=28.68 TRINITY_DN62275_c0_g1_i2:145-1314(-)